MTRVKQWAPLLLLTVLFLLFRAPALLNPGFINSDGTRAALQASRMLEGEWQWLHWHRTYLTSIDSVMMVPFFALFGATPRVVMGVTLVGQLLGACLAYAIVARRTAAWTGFVATLPLVFMTLGSNMYLFFNIRQWCMALALLAFLLIDRAAEAARPRRMMVLGLLVGCLAWFVDLFAVQLMPGLVVFAVLSALGGARGERKTQLLAVTAGVAVGLMVLLSLRSVAHVQTLRATLDPQLMARNWPLLVDQVIPWLIGTKIFAFTAVGNVALVPSPPWFFPVQFAGAMSFVAILLSGAGLLFVPHIPWRVRVLGAAGSCVAATSLLGFVGSVAASDLWGTRLLLPVILTLPLTLAPLSHLLGRWFTPAVLPLLLTMAIGGWLSYGVLVDGPLPRQTARGDMREDLALGEFLRARGIHHAAADYWVAYRLTFILQEDPIVVSEASEGLYSPWRDQFDAAPVVAYLTHPSAPDLATDDLRFGLKQRKLEYEKVSVHGFTVFLVKRR